jgi:hypothetical protein
MSLVFHFSNTPNACFHSFTLTYIFKQSCIFWSTHLLTQSMCSQCVHLCRTVNGILGSLASLFGLALFSLLMNLYIVVFGGVCILLEWVSVDVCEPSWFSLLTVCVYVDMCIRVGTKIEVWPRSTSEQLREKCIFYFFQWDEEYFIRFVELYSLWKAVCSVLCQGSASCW